MQLTINGDPHTVAAPLTLAELIDRHRSAGNTSPGGRGSAAAVDGEVVPRAEWSTFAVRDGQAIEILTAVQGG